MYKKIGLLAVSIILSSVASVSMAAEAKAASCPAYLNQTFKKLHSTEDVNLCELYKGKPLVIVNTASHCGYTYQFKALETLYQKYKSQGVELIGFTSDDFKQAAKSEMEAATICYENYGVTFTMLAPTVVKGEHKNSVFTHLTNTTKDPKWNFNKYVVSADGKVVEYFDSKVEPTDSALEESLKALL